MLTLYERLGGADGIRRIIDDVVANHLSNPAVHPRFAHVADLGHLKEMVFQFFCMGSGGPQVYCGKDMRSAHRGMNISEQEYLAVMDDILTALASNNVAEDARHEVIAILYSLKDEVIRQ
ncbi:group 1 truncated hemoglobin [Vogesella sp. LIG4]|uniref:group I truncated hemoglobin n=1 Tax=Vogesella sp. LIG4 TaxID=1192162 RepID=UPI00081FE7EE|nr:group 1 truncated hemoglobin [Vogesella sp. LIG4]SCK12447.1 hemoglobin [Vogesella sp. LIG4]